MSNLNIEPKNDIDSSEIQNGDQSISSLNVEPEDQIDTVEIDETKPIMQNTPTHPNVIVPRLGLNVVMPVPHPNINSAHLVPNGGEQGLISNVGVLRSSPIFGFPTPGSNDGVPLFSPNFGVPPFALNTSALRPGPDISLARFSNNVDMQRSSPNFGILRLSKNIDIPGLSSNFGMQRFSQHSCGIRPCQCNSLLHVDRNSGMQVFGQNIDGPRLRQNTGGTRFKNLSGTRFGQNMCEPILGLNMGQLIFGQNMDRPRFGQNVVPRVGPSVRPIVRQNVFEPSFGQNVKNLCDSSSNRLVLHLGMDDCYNWVCEPPYHVVDCIPSCYQ